jgi:hypothetical protein
MSKWEMPTGDYWDKWFKEAHRVLKNGGWLIMFGIDRQLLLFKYYALLAGFEEQQSLYWYFISNFPKATDLSKMLDKQEGRLGDGELKRQELGKYIGAQVKEKYTNQELAKILGRSEKSAFIHHWVNGKYIPLYEELQKLRNLIDLPNDKLLIWEQVTKEAEREVIGTKIVNGDETTAGGYSNGVASIDGKDINIKREIDITTPSTDLAKKYDGYKYSISPLKQTNETIMIFKKPSKTGSVLHDTLAFENGDTTINVSALDIDGNRVGTSDNTIRHNHKAGIWSDKDKETITGDVDGRYPAQTFIDNQVAEILDEQSGVSVSKSFVGKLHDIRGGNFGNNEVSDKMIQDSEYKGGYDDIGGASKILHKCNYEQDDVTLYHYEPKVSGSERNAGLGGFDAKPKAEGNSTMGHNPNDVRCTKCNKRPNTVGNENNSCECDKPIWDWYKQKNHHPTLKPIELNYRILKLFKLPTDQKICYPFAGSGSEIIGGIKAGFENWVGCEINAEYVAIANARINYWKETMWEQQSLFDEVI